jgi:hypothetical protein
VLAREAFASSDDIRKATGLLGGHRASRQARSRRRVWDADRRCAPATPTTRARTRPSRCVPQHRRLVTGRAQEYPVNSWPGLMLGSGPRSASARAVPSAARVDRQLNCNAGSTASHTGRPSSSVIVHNAAPARRSASRTAASRSPSAVSTSTANPRGGPDAATWVDQPALS